MEGLEGAIVDADNMTLVALEASDMRMLDVRVAGPAALLVAKVHKINDRLGGVRQTDEDALDVFRLLRGTDTNDLAVRYQRLLADRRSTDAAILGKRLLREQFATHNGSGITMMIRSAGVLAAAEVAVIAESCLVLAKDLLVALES